MDIPALLTQTNLGLYIVLVGFGLVATWEGFCPARRASISVPLRWTNNFLWYAVNSLFLTAVFAYLAVASNAMLSSLAWSGLSGLGLPIWIEVAISLLLLDLVGYWVHLLLHKSPVLWRLHAIHHSDIDFDCTTGFRFHPLEGLLTQGIRFAVIAVSGMGPMAVALYGLWLGLQNLYGHANARFPVSLERILRWLVVTPDMHRVHHSARLDESMCNYGIVFPWWDHLFGTYLNEPLGGHEKMLIGLDWWRSEGLWSLPRLVVLPCLTPFPSSRAGGE